MRIQPFTCLVAAAGAVVALSSGCAQGCLSVKYDGESGVAVVIAGPGRPGAVMVEVCVSGTCTSASASGTGSRVFVANPAVTSTASTPVVVTVRTQDGADLVLREQVTLNATEEGPRDARCGPRVFVGTVTVTPTP
jgi:hypothetical protein